MLGNENFSRKRQHARYIVHTHSSGLQLGSEGSNSRQGNKSDSPSNYYIHSVVLPGRNDEQTLNNYQQPRCTFNPPTGGQFNASVPQFSHNSGTTAEPKQTAGRLPLRQHRITKQQKTPIRTTIERVLMCAAGMQFPIPEYCHNTQTHLLTLWIHSQRMQ